MDVDAVHDESSSRLLIVPLTQKSVGDDQEAGFGAMNGTLQRKVVALERALLRIYRKVPVPA